MSDKKLLSSEHWTFKLFGDFTVKWLVEQLIEIEKNASYETALLCANTVDYRELCELVQTSDEPENNPHLMPSRFMILPGAKDEELEAQGNLDTCPKPVHEKAPPLTLSVEHLVDGLISARLVDEGYQYDNFDPDVLHQFLRYLDYIESTNENLSLKDDEKTHTTKLNESLSSIATLYSIPSALLLYEINEDAMGDNKDVLVEGIELKLPTKNNNPLYVKMETLNFKKYIGGSSYQYPYYHFSMSLFEEGDELFEDYSAEEERECCFYVKELVKQEGKDFEKITQLFSIPIKVYDEINVMLPRLNTINWGLKGVKFYHHGEICVHPDDLPLDDSSYITDDNIRDGVTGIPPVYIKYDSTTN